MSEEEAGQPKFKVIRVLAYIGTQKALEDHLGGCWVDSRGARTGGTPHGKGRVQITEIVRTLPAEIPEIPLSEYPEIPLSEYPE